MVSWGRGRGHGRGQDGVHEKRRPDVKIVNLNHKTDTYSSNAYFVTGTWNTLQDINTLVDVGREPKLLERLARANVGVGQPRLAQIVLTHCHYDHTSLVPQLRELYRPMVCAFSPFEGVDRVLRHGDLLRLGDRTFEVLHIPGHSSDSICLVCDEEGVLFSGDTTIWPLARDASHEEEYLRGLAGLIRRRVRIVYPGHGSPLEDDISRRVAESLAELGWPR